VPFGDDHFNYFTLEISTIMRFTFCPKDLHNKQIAALLPFLIIMGCQEHRSKQMQADLPVDYMDPCAQIELHKEPKNRLQCMKHNVERLSEELKLKQEFLENHPNRPWKTKIISSGTTDTVYGAYYSEWKRKLERIGSLNFPKEAVSKGGQGSTVLHTRIAANGVLLSADIRKSSGIKLIDDTAILVAKLASPFDRFSEHMHKEVDIVDIIGTVQFRLGE
jgi:TonB family protein